MSIKLEVTQEAKTHVQQLIQSQKPGTAVRVFLQTGGGGGCGSGSGGGCGCGGAGGGCGSESSTAALPTFGMAFDKVRNGDEVIKVDGFSVVADAGSAEFLEGATIDFVQGLEESGFKIVSPMLEAARPPASSHEGESGGCGCGAGGGGGCC
jgi:Fe-S cluster assembly iron-binding protein IscA